MIHSSHDSWLMKHNGMNIDFYKNIHPFVRPNMSLFLSLLIKLEPLVGKLGLFPLKEKHWEQRMWLANPYWLRLMKQFVLSEHTARVESLASTPSDALRGVADGR